MKKPMHFYIPRSDKYLIRFGLLFLTCNLLLFFSCRQSAHDSDFEAYPFLLEGATLQQLQEKMERGEMTSVQITKLYLNRIRTIDQNGPKLNAVIELNPDALLIAASLDSERKGNKVRSLLHGIPILVKDNIDTGDQMQTTAGSLAMKGHHAAQDAFVIKQLRAAGAVILGKTNMSEWANMRSPNSISGWSSRGGQTKNPYNLSASPCGSSTGSAVAVAADLCVVAVGTSTNGSVACPAGFNGVVGIRPTIGRVSRTGIIPISGSQDTPGAFGRTVKDAAVLLQMMCGHDPMDISTQTLGVEDFQLALTTWDTTALVGKRIGIEKGMLREKEGIGKLLNISIETMRQHGAIIVEVEYVQKYNELSDIEFEVLLHEFKAGINHYLSASGFRFQSLEDIIQYNRENASKVMPFFGQEHMETALTKGGLETKEYIEALDKIKEMRFFLDHLMAEYHLDALAGVGFGAYSPPALAGFPSITIPMGTVNHLPLGLTFFGRPFDEARLLPIAYAYEHFTKNRISPTFVPFYINM